MATEKTQKNAKKYYCEICDFNTCNKNDYTRHLSTLKHIRNKSATFSNADATGKTQHYICCNCNKEYRDRSGLWRHKKNLFIARNL